MTPRSSLSICWWEGFSITKWQTTETERQMLLFFHIWVVKKKVENNVGSTAPLLSSSYPSHLFVLSKFVQTEVVIYRWPLLSVSQCFLKTPEEVSLLEPPHRPHWCSHSVWLFQLHMKTFTMIPVCSIFIHAIYIYVYAAKFHPAIWNALELQAGQIMGGGVMHKWGRETDRKTAETWCWISPDETFRLIFFARSVCIWYLSAFQEGPLSNKWQGKCD